MGILIGIKRRHQHDFRWKDGVLGRRTVATAYLKDEKGRRHYGKPVCGDWVWYNWRGRVQGEKNIPALDAKALAELPRYMY